MPDTPFQVLPADPRSVQAAALIASLSAELAARYDFDDDGSANFKPEDALVPGSGFVIGWLGELAVACGAFRPSEPRIAEIKRMFVLPPYRRRGYARAVLTALEDLARQSGYQAVRLETADRQPDAVALYERSGYHRIPNYGVFADSPRSICFEKTLNSRTA
ncbi:MAG: GNAT family N-acetyltransferase [Tepidisphaerales bacterium]